jgi:hypothetical protein
MHIIETSFGLDAGFIYPAYNHSSYNNSSTVITSWTTLEAYLIFTLWELAFLPTSRLPWPMLKILAATNF